MDMSLRKIVLVSIAVGGVFGASHRNNGPVVFEPSGEWNGDDGQFGTFSLTVGAPSQKVHVLPDPFRSAVLLVGPEGCQKDSLFEGCSSKRGNVFDRVVSSSWHNVDSQEWDPTESNIAPPRNNGQNKSAKQPGMFRHPLASKSGNHFGVDQLSGAFGGKKWHITDQGIMSIVDMNPFVGRLGLATKLNGKEKHPVSLFDNIRSSMKLKSASWSYTAGNKGRNAPPSLVLGGYDASRIERSSTLAAAQPHPDRSLRVTLRSLVVTAPGITDPAGPRFLALGGVFATLDFTRPHLEFPKSVCDILSEHFGLEFDHKLRRYTVNDTRHEELLSQGANLQFVMTGTQGPQKNFVIPYSSLVMEGSFPSSPEPTRYLALQRSGGNRFNLGRAFFQDTYLTAEFDRPSGPYIYLSQARYEPKEASKIKEMDPARYLRHTRKHDDNLGIILPIVFVVLALIAIALYIVYARKAGWVPFRRKPEAAAATREAQVESAPTPEEDYPVDRKMIFEDIDEDEDAKDVTLPPPPRYSVAIAEDTKKPEEDKA